MFLQSLTTMNWVYICIGLPLYVASSVFVRHAMIALYTDLAVAMHKVKIHSSPPSSSSPPPSSSPLSEGSSPTPTPPPQSLPESPPNKSRVQQKNLNRERSITIGLLVSGSGRLGLSTERAEWDVYASLSFPLLPFLSPLFSLTDNPSPHTEHQHTPSAQPQAASSSTPSTPSTPLPPKQSTPPSNPLFPLSGPGSVVPPVRTVLGRVAEKVR